jgi:hypothetical protein
MGSISNINTKGRRKASHQTVSKKDGAHSNKYTKYLQCPLLRIILEQAVTLRRAVALARVRVAASSGEQAEAFRACAGDDVLAGTGGGVLVGADGEGRGRGWRSIPPVGRAAAF